VRLESGRQLQARLVIGADGAASRVRQAACIRAHEHDYHQCAIVAVVKTEYPHRETAWQRFLPTGPLAFLPLRDGLSSIVWSTTTTESERLMALEAEDFHAELAASFGYRLGRIQRSGPRAVFALRRLHAEQYVRPRLALIGDAAHMIHPLAGQGVNLGILDAAVLAEVVTDARRSGRDAGSLPVLRRYERWRRGENLIMMTAMDGFNLAFASSLMPVREVRNLGLRLADAMAPLKQLFMKHAMGLSGDLPRLARRA
jgi:2-octaprenylphenol hydroxylase